MLNIAIAHAASSIYRAASIDKLLTEWAQHNNLPISDNAVIAHTNGVNIGFSVSAGNGRNGGYMAAVAVEPSTWNKAIQKALKKELKGVGTLVYEKNTGNVYIMMAGGRFSKDKLYSKFDTAAYTLANRLPQMGVVFIQTCYFCHNIGCDSFVVDEGLCRPAHAGCKHAHTQQLLSEIAENETNGNYLLGIIGALLGGIVGMIPSLLLLLFVNLISAWSFMLVPIAAAYGYKLFKGIQNKMMLLVVVLDTIVLTCALVLGLFYMENVAYYGIFLPWDEFVEELLYVDLEYFVVELGQCLLFSGLGIVFSWGYINKTNKARLEKMRALQAQAVAPDPYGQMQVQAPVQQAGIPPVPPVQEQTPPQE